MQKGLKLILDIYCMTTNSNTILQLSDIEYCCIKCKYNTVRKSSYDKHLLTSKHKLATNCNTILQNTNIEYCCEKCNYNTIIKNRYDTHLLTAKHKLANKVAITLKCENCDKLYNNRSGLWRHKKKCTQSINKDELILSLIKQNAVLIQESSEQTKKNTELQSQILELIKNGTNNATNNTTNNTTNNNNNNTFNLNFFLNETCKNAMNLEDFINSIKWQVSELEMVGRLGYVKGVSKFIIDKFNLMAENKRPIHCTDAKREVLYVKDDDKWEKEQEDYPKLHRAIKKVSRQELIFPLLQEYRNLNPEHNVCDSDVSTQYNRIITEVLCGGISDESDADKKKSIIKNISKEVTIKK